MEDKNFVWNSECIINPKQKSFAIIKAHEDYHEAFDCAKRIANVISNGKISPCVIEMIYCALQTKSGV